MWSEAKNKPQTQGTKQSKLKTDLGHCLKYFKHNWLIYDGIKKKQLHQKELLLSSLRQHKEQISILFW